MLEIELYLAMQDFGDVWLYHSTLRNVCTCIYTILHLAKISKICVRFGLHPHTHIRGQGFAIEVHIMVSSHLLGPAGLSLANVQYIKNSAMCCNSISDMKSDPP